MKKVLWFLVVASVIASLVISACTSSAISQPVKPAESKPAAEAKPATEAKPAEKPAEKAAASPAVVIKAVNFLPKNHAVAPYAQAFADRVNEQGKNLNIRIDYLGGPEVIPALEQVEALRKGVTIQMTFSPSAYYAPMAPEVDVLQLSRVLPWDERKPGGMFDLMVDRHQKIGLQYLGRWTWNMPFYLYTNKKVEKPEQLAGQKMRTTALYDPFMKALKIQPITMGFGDVYTSIEKGVIDGYGWTGIGIVDAGLPKVTKFRIEPSIYEQNTTILVNQDVFAKLSKPQQDMLKDVAVKLEPDLAKHFADAEGKEREAMIKAGIQILTFSPQDNKAYVDLAYKVQWDEIDSKVKDAALLTKLRQAAGWQ